MDKRLFTILMIVFVQMLGAAMILPILPLYAQSEYDLSPQVITLLGTAFFAAQFVAGPFLGRLSDNRGRLPVLIISQIGTAISFAMLAFAPSAGILFLARILDGITGGNLIVAQAYVTDITPREKRTEALGYIFAAFGIGFVVGPALGGILAAAVGPRAPYLIASVAAVAVVLLTWFTLEETVTPEQREINRSHDSSSIGPIEILRNMPLMLILSVAFIGQFGLGLLQGNVCPLWRSGICLKVTVHKPVALGIGLLLATFGLTQFLTQALLLRRALRHFGEYGLVIIGSMGRIIGSFIFAIVATPVLGAVGSVFFAHRYGPA